MLILGFFSLWLSIAPSQAHEIRPAIIDLSFDQQGFFTLKVNLNLEAMIAQISPEHKDTKNAKNASRYDALRKLTSEELFKEFERFQPILIEGIRLSFDQTPSDISVTQLDIPPIGDIDQIRLSLIYLTAEAPMNTVEFNWAWRESFGASALRVSSPDNPELYTAYLTAGKSSASIPLIGQIEQSGLDIFTTYLDVGFTHIIPKGLDHILFVVGLFLLSIQLRPLLWQITSFTIAHSITLALAMLGIVEIAPSIVEPLIALSIIYVCVENIYSDKLSRWRPLVIFLFGLLHGLGFAGVLREIGTASDHFLNSLIAFNLGVEFGQLSVIFIAFVLVGLAFKDKPWYRQRISIPLSSIIALIGGYWFIERIFFA